MRLTEKIWYALEEQRHHKMRTGLTLLGMVFGVGAVIAMLSIGEGAEKEALNLIENMGLQNLIIESKPIDSERLAEVRKQSLGVNLRDVDAVRESIPQIINTSAEKQIKTQLVFGINGKSDASVLAVTPDYFELGNYLPADGTLFSESDNTQLAQKAVLGAEAAKLMFPDGHALGQRVKINHVWFEVVGVLTDKALSKSSFEGRSLGGDRKLIFVPLKTALNRFKINPLESELDGFKIRLADGVNPISMAPHVNALLQRRHNNTDDFEVVVPAGLMEQHRETRRIFTIVMSCVAGISLLVGGIGIMNIMLASVLERTREVGLLRAVGATQKDIMWQFLLESATVTLLGGFLGIFFGYFIAWVIALFSDWAIGFSLFGMILSVVVCATIGLVFGIYPAMKAAELDPILALQRE